MFIELLFLGLILLGPVFLFFFSIWKRKTYRLTFLFSVTVIPSYLFIYWINPLPPDIGSGAAAMGFMLFAIHAFVFFAYC